MLVSRAATRTFRSLTDASIWKYMFLGLFLTALLFALIQFATWSLLLNTTLLQESWMEWAVDIIGGGLAFVIGLFLFPIIVPVIVSLFDTNIANHVESVDYPEIGGATYEPSLIAEIGRALRFLVVAVGLNLIVVPLYFLPLANLPIYFALNGYLLGREFFESMAIRHLSYPDVTKLRRKHRLTVWIAGACVAVAAVTPIVNLFTPVIAVVMMVHLLHLVHLSQEGSAPVQGQIEQ